MNVYEKLKHIRKQYHLTQQEIANELGITRAHYANIEIGKINPTDLFLTCVSLRFNIDMDWLCDDNQTEAQLNNPIYTLIVKKEDVFEMAKKMEKLDVGYLKLVSQMVDGMLELQEK